VGHKACRVLDGGRGKWKAEGRPMTTATPSYPRATYTAKPQDKAIRAFRDEVREHAGAGRQLVDVRSWEEYVGQRTHMAEYPQEGVLRGGHIPGAKSVPWGKACRTDGTFKSREELETLYLREQGLKPSEPVVAYCRIGERSSHTWFVLTYLLGFPKVKNYDGSWTEWGNSVGLPIAKGG